MHTLFWKVADIIGIPTYLAAFVITLGDVRFIAVIFAGCLYAYGRHRKYMAEAKIKEEEARTRRIENDEKEYEFNKRRNRDSEPRQTPPISETINS